MSHRYTSVLNEETRSTIKVFDSIGERLDLKDDVSTVYPTWKVDIAWTLRTPNNDDPLSDNDIFGLIVGLQGKRFVKGLDMMRDFPKALWRGFEFLEYIADQYPDVARKLAEPMDD